MCDTIVALPSATASGGALFGKNSDRERNEALAVEYLPAARYAAGTTLRCTCIDIPQVAETHGALLCRPFWMWGRKWATQTGGYPADGRPYAAAWRDMTELAAVT